MLKTIARKFDPAPDAISLLEADHRKVEGLFKQFDSADNRRSKASLARQICMEMEIHAKLEEKIFYPTAKAQAKQARDEVNEGIVEHEAIDRLIKQISTLDAGDEFFDMRVKVLQEFFKHHVHDEETEMFPKIVESRVNLKALGEKMQQAKQRLQKAAHAAQARSAARKPSARTRAARKARA